MFNLFLITLSFFIVIFFTPLIQKLGKKFNIIDFQDERKIQQIQAVKIGGISIYLNLLICSIILFLFGKTFIAGFSTSFLVLFLVTSTMVFFIGILDDFFNISPFVRLFFQILISIVVWKFGIRIEALDLSILGFDQFLKLNEFFSILITLFWITGLINAINWIDGIDGLAVGISCLAALGISILSSYFGNSLASSFCLLFVGSALGFFIFNIKPGKIIMGDCGSNLLGYSLAVLSIKGLTVSNGIDNLVSFEIIGAFLIFFIPIVDMTRIIFIRIYSKNSPFLPDRNHFHYILVDKGISTLNVTFLICTLSLLFNLLALIMVKLRI